MRLQRPVAASRSEVTFHRRTPQRRQLRRTAVPRHRGALDVVPEVVEAELVAEAVAPDDPAEDVQVLRLAVGGEAHHLVLVAVLGEAEVLRDGRVEDAEGVRERNLPGDLEVVSLPDAPHRAHHVAEAVDREHGRPFERRDVERGADVREVVLDEVRLRAERGLGDAEALRQRGLGSEDLPEVRGPLGGHLPAGSILQGVEHAASEVRARVAGQGEVVDVLGSLDPRSRGSSGSSGGGTTCRA